MAKKRLYPVNKEYTKFLLSILEACYGKFFTHAQQRIVEYIIRQTDGFHQDSYRITYNKFCSNCAMTRKTLNKELHTLINMNVVRRDIVNGKHYYRIWHDPFDWDGYCEWFEHRHEHSIP